MPQTPAAQHLCTKVAGSTLRVAVVVEAVVVVIAFAAAAAVADTDSKSAGKLQEFAAVTADA
jgi:ABC-type spermidine/putrescine transport system permease subunit I